MSYLDSIISTIENLLGYPEQLPIFIVLLLGTGLFITLRFYFIQFFRLKHSFQVVMGKYDDPDDEGDVSHFQALTVALSATVGVGNIAGVALAIHYGGPGAIFWMWLTAFFGMALKFVECTLALKYRVIDDQGEASGGPMYYIEKGLGNKSFGIFFAVCAVLCSFCTGNMNQSNTVASVLSARFSLSSTGKYVIGIILCLIVGSVILGGVKRIAKVTEKLAPIMASVYFLAAFVIIVLNMEQLPSLITSIFTQAFRPESAFGGTVAGTLTMTMLIGIKRGLFSNEAGQGSAPIAHASAKTNEPVREGIVAMMGPFIDTLVICSLTAFVLLITNTWNQKYEVNLSLDEIQIVQSIDKFANTIAYTGQFEVNNGHAVGVKFVSNHALIDEVLIYKDSKEFSGSIIIDKNAKINLKGLTIKGNSLLSGAPLTSKAFQIGLSSIFAHGDLIVDLCVILFAISTIISWCYYGDRSFVYLFGTKQLILYRLVYLFFVFLGAILPLYVVWRIGDVALSLMALPNLIAILFLHKEVLNDSKEYFKKYS
ncbi:MAG: sodium:alanine symporter family protein [Candidatus Cloacimonadota bacterium]|nr:MAG: sodium:alanine symporter family protein [Candidatus Cloacimonadota bacterium]